MLQYVRKAERLTRNAQIHKVRAEKLREEAKRELAISKSFERAAKLLVTENK
jgi:hypothetical protein